MQVRRMIFAGCGVSPALSTQCLTTLCGVTVIVVGYVIIHVADFQCRPTIIKELR